MPQLDMAGAFEGLTQSAQRARRSSGAYGDNGEYTPGSETLTTIQAAIHPATLRDLERMPAGFDTSDTIHILTPSNLQSGKDTHHPDQLLYSSRRYEVVQVDDWTDVGGFVEALAIRKDAS